METTKTTKKNPQRGYNYQAEEGRFCIYKGTKRVLTPRNAEVWTESERLAQELVLELKHSPKGYANADNLLCYHYTFCDLVELFNYSKEQLSEEMKQLVSSERLLQDGYLLFLQCSPMKIAYVNFFLDVLPDWLDSLDYHYLVACLVMINSHYSIVLPFHIINDVVGAIAQGKDPQECVESFSYELEDYLLDECIEWYSDVASTINKFAFYCLNL